MANLANLNFNARQVEPAKANVLLPAGWYDVLIDNSEVVPTKAGDSTILKIRYSVVDGEFAGKKVFGQLNIANPNPIAQDIAFKQLSAICHAVNVLDCQDSQQLHNIPFKIRVKVKHSDGYEPSNEVTGWEKAGANTGAAITPSAQTPKAAPKAPATKAPVAPPAAPAGWGAPATPKPAPKPAPVEVEQDENVAPPWAE